MVISLVVMLLTLRSALSFVHKHSSDLASRSARSKLPDIARTGRAASSLPSMPAINHATSDYEFIDCGDGMRLERFGEHLVARSCIAASSWHRNAHNPHWAARPRIEYRGDSGKAGQWKGDSILTKKSKWLTRFDRKVFTLNTHDMGQVGVFPEQQANWKWIESNMLKHAKRADRREGPIQVLNGFAFTGGSTMAALAHEDVLVTHLDASKTFSAIAADNIKQSQCSGSVRWIVDDCLTFVQREVRRQVKYDAIIMDPPAFGRFDSKIWKIDQDFPSLLAALPRLLSAKPSFVLLTCHDDNWPAATMRDALKDALSPFFKVGTYEHGDMVLDPVVGSAGSKLALGSFARWSAKYP